MNKTKKRRIVALALFLSAVCIVTPLSIWASNAEPTIGSVTNVANSAIVNNAGANVTELYREDKKVTFNAGDRGSFGELVFGSTNTYTYSADVTFQEDNSTYGSIRFVLGTGIRTVDNKACTIEVGIQPNCNDAVLFANANGDEGEALAHIGGIEGLDIGNTYRYTVKYENGKVSFWANNGKLIFDEIDITGSVKDIALTTAYYSQNCKGTISDVKIWGDVKPLIDTNAKNMADEMSVSNNGTDVTESYKNTKTISVNGPDTIVSGRIENLIFGTTNRYVVTADVKFTADSSSYGSIRLCVGTGLDANGNQQTIDVCMRPNLDDSLIGCYWSSDPWGQYPYVGSIAGEFNQSYRYTALYDNGKITFWVDGTLLASEVNMNSILTNVKPALGFNTQNCTGTISNLIIQGDVEGITVPEFDADKNENVLTKSVLLDSTGIPSAFTSDMGMAYTQTGEGGFVRYTFAGLQYGKNYCFSTKAKFQDNTAHTDWGHEGLRFLVATAKKDGAQYNIEVNVRQGIFAIFASRINEANQYTETVHAIIDGQNNPYNTEQTYSIRYRENGNFDFFQNNRGIYTNYDLKTLGYTDVKPCVGIGGEVCAFSYSDMKLWGDISVDETKVPEIPVEPVFDADKDTNLMKQVSVRNPITGKQTVLTDCAIASGDGVTGDTKMTVYGLVFGKSYKFSTNAAFFDNPSVEHESIVIKVATAEKDGNTYDVEVQFRNGYALFKAGDTELTQDVVYMTGTTYGTISTYSVEYRKDNTINAFIDGKSIFFKYDLTEKGYTNVKPAFGFGGGVCSYNYTGMKLWGDLKFNKDLVPEVPEEPVFDSDADINLMQSALVTNPETGKTEVPKNYELTTTKAGVALSEATVNGLVYGKSYAFSTKASFEDNKKMSGDNEVNWEGLMFKVATVEKDGKTYPVQIRVRNGLVGIFVDETPYALDYGKTTAYGSENQYTVVYHKDGTFSMFKNGITVYWKYDLTEEGYTNVKPSFAFGGEVCAFSFKEMKLWGDIYLKELPSVPKKPASNGNYADYMRVSQSSMIKYEDGKIYSTSDEITGRTEFEYLPFDVNDTYVFGFHVNTKKAEQIWMGPRILFGVTKEGKELALYIMENGIGVFNGSESVQTIPFSRELNHVYRVDMLIKPESVSVWLDNILVIEDLKLPKKAEVKTGILFENAVAVLSHLDMYYTKKVKFVAPEIPEPPVLKTLKDGQYNAADWMTVTLNGQKYGGYFDNKLASNDSSAGNRYLFENLPVKDNMSFYYSATYNVTESSEIWKGPRFIFRQDGSTAFYAAVLQDSIVLLAGAEQVASSPLKLQLGKNYDIVMYSTPTEISVWIDGVLIFESVDLTSYINKKLTATPGVLFELCQAKVTNLAIYGDKIVFDEKYVDEELYYSKYYQMRGIPQMTGANLFENVFMTDLSNGAIGAEYDSENRVLTTAYPEGNGVVLFRDANGSANLNGLKNGTGYVLSFKYRVDDWQAEKAGESGFWFTTNSSAGPWTTETNAVSLGFSGDAVMLGVDKEGVEITKQDVIRERKNGKVYDVAIVHGKNWIKLYVDNELQMVSTQLPTYNTEFQIWFSNVKSELSDFKLYEFEDSGLKVLETVEGNEKTWAGNTIYDADEHVFSTTIKAPILILIVLGDVALICAVVIVVMLLKRKKMGGNVSCKEKE